MRFYVLLIVALFLASFVSVDAAPIDQAKRKRIGDCPSCYDCWTCRQNIDDPVCAGHCEDCELCPE
uniref:Gsp_67 putative toxin n=1 Tax=Gemmula speciosa TaxID=439592 RepID=A0A098LW77_GEMSP